MTFELNSISLYEVIFGYERVIRWGVLMNKIQRVYPDTSVIGGYCDKEFAVWSRGLFKDFRVGNFKVVISELIASEIEEAPKSVKDAFSELLTYGYEWIEMDKTAFELADIYQTRKILTPKHYDDGMHIALATLAEVDVLVSWNFKHIVHLDKIRLFNAVNLELGYKILQIYSPREVTHYGKE